MKKIIEWILWVICGAGGLYAFYSILMSLRWVLGTMGDDHYSLGFDLTQAVYGLVVMMLAIIVLAFMNRKKKNFPQR